MDVETAAERLWRFHSVSDPLTQADAIVGLGSYDLRVASRCAELFRQGWAPEIVFSGAAGNWTRDLYPASEAEAFRDRGIAEGVPDERIMLETHATNIGENMRFSAVLLPKARKVILVTKPQTQLRARATVQKQWPQVRASVRAPAVSLDSQPLPHHNRRAVLCEMVGDLVRMADYAARGFQTEVSIPQNVQEAADVLIAAGFTDHLPQIK